MGYPLSAIEGATLFAWVALNILLRGYHFCMAYPISAIEGLPYLHGLPYVCYRGAIILHGLPYVCYRGTRSSVQLVYVTNAVATISNEVAFHAASDYSLEDCHISGNTSPSPLRKCVLTANR